MSIYAKINSAKANLYGAVMELVYMHDSKSCGETHVGSTPTSATKKTYMKIDIHKAAGIIIQNRKLLIERSKGKEIFMAPGGKVEPGESVKQALVRELKEEFNIDVDPSDLEAFGSFIAQAAGQEDRTLQSDVFIVKKWDGEPIATSEVEEIKWINSRVSGIKIGSIVEHEIIPRLKALKLID